MEVSLHHRVIATLLAQVVALKAENEKLKSPATDRCLKSLPKAELHIHLEGAMRPATLTELCKKHSVERPGDTRGVQFENFGGFVSTYIAACECLQDEDDIYRLVREVAEDAATSGALWIEMALSMCLYYQRYGGMLECLKLIMRAATEAEIKTGVGIGLIVSAERMLDLFPMELADELAKAVATLVSEGEAIINGHIGIVGFGLHGDESVCAPDPFDGVFASACQCCYKGMACKVAAIPHGKCLSSTLRTL
jgi:adenosine deaminase